MRFSKQITTAVLILSTQSNLTSATEKQPLFKIIPQTRNEEKVHSTTGTHKDHIDAVIERYSLTNPNISPAPHYGKLLEAMLTTQNPSAESRPKPDYTIRAIQSREDLMIKGFNQNVKKVNEKFFWNALNQGHVELAKRILVMTPILARENHPQTKCPPAITAIASFSIHRQQEYVIDLLKLLKEADAYINVVWKNSPVSSYPITPLSKAISLLPYSTSIIDVLLQYGADPEHESVTRALDTLKNEKFLMDHVQYKYRDALNSVLVKLNKDPLPPLKSKL